MSGYAIAWLAVLAAGMIGAYLAFVLFRPLRRLRYLAAGVVLAWAATPYFFDGNHAAPALPIALFRLLFEPDANWRVPLALAVAATLGVSAAYLVAVGVGALVARHRRRRAHAM